MTKLKLRYIHRFRDRHGHLRHYFRRHGRCVPLPGEPGSDEFMEAYRAAVAGQGANIGARRLKSGTVAAAVASYLASASFQAMAPTSQSTRRNILEHFRKAHGDKRIATFGREQVVQGIAARAHRPSSARKFASAISGLMQHCIAVGLRDDDPTLGVKRPKIRKTEGHYTWTEDDVARYRARHPLGTRARLALELLAGFGQRRGDTVLMGRQHIRQGILSLRQSKTGVLVEIPVLPEVWAAIDAMESDSLTFLITEFGKPFSPAGFGNWFREQRVAAGLPRGSAHGLRKYAATRHAENGATAHQLMAWFGWETLAEAERYTRAANRRRLAREMGEKLSGTVIRNPEVGVAKSDD